MRISMSSEERSTEAQPQPQRVVVVNDQNESDQILVTIRDPFYAGIQLGFGFFVAAAMVALAGWIIMIVISAGQQ